MQRTVQPELLDQLPHDDPGAVGSRRDLRRINALMGNHRWLCKEATSEADKTVVELGAGDGTLSKRMARAGAVVKALDLAPAPSELPAEIEWQRGDFFETLQNVEGETLIACLILHHFESPQLKRLGELIENSSITRLLAAEPHRSGSSLFLARLLFPFINPVTRHDITISVRAGFRRGELAAALDLDSRIWTVEETTSLLGGYRFQATRIADR